jgi:hypothetical protein
MGQDVPRRMRVLEINPGCPALEVMNEMFTSGADE